MSVLLKSVQIFPDLKGAHDPELSYKKFDEVQHRTSIYVAAEDIPAGTEITDPRWVVKLDNSAAYAAEQAREEAEALRVAAEAVRMGFVPMGAYNPANENKYGEWYTHEGGSYGYIYPTPSTGVPVTDTTHWQQIAAQGMTGPSAYDAAVAGGYTGTEAEFNAVNAGIEAAESGRVDAENIRSEFYDGFSSQLADVVQDVDALEITVNRLESKNTHKYGVLWDEVNHQCTRLYDAVNITTNTANFGHFGAVNPSYNNPFDKIYPWSHRKVCNVDVDIYQALPDGADIKDCIIAWEGDPDFAMDGTNGAVMVYTPEFWSAEKSVAGGREFVVADDFVPSFKRQEESIGARWFGVDDGTGGLTSIPGMPIAGVPMSTIHSMATSKKMTLDDIYTWSADNILMYVEYATLNSQIALGNGVDSLHKQGLRPLVAETGVNRVVLAKADANLFIVGSIIDIGTTDGASNTARRIVTSVTEVDATNSAVNFDGVAVDITTELYVSLHGLSNMADADLKSGSGYIGINGKSNAYYRGRVAHANLFRYVLGAYREKDTGKYWVAKNRNDAAAADALNTSVHIDTGCTLPYKEDGVTQDEGYIKDMYLYGDIPANLFVKTVGGNGTNPIGDYLYHPVKSSDNTVLCTGGRSPYGAACGRLYSYWASTASGAYWHYSGLPFLKNP